MAVGVSATAIALLLFALGMVHGAVDADRGRLVGPGWGYSLIYLFLMGAAGLFFVAAPTNALLIFFALSAWHFAHEQMQRGEGRFAAWGDGLMLVGAPFLLAPGPTGALLATMGMAFPDPLGTAMAVVGAAGLVALAVGRRFVRVALLAASYALLPPLLAVALHFAILHAFVRIDELWREAGGSAALRASAPFALVAVAGAGVSLWALREGWIAPVLFSAVALAALVPHMLLDRSWAEGWHHEKGRRIA